MTIMPRLLNEGGNNVEKNSLNKFENESQYAELAALFKTFAEETRLKIMFAISEKELCV